MLRMREKRQDRSNRQQGAFWPSTGPGNFFFFRPAREPLWAIESRFESRSPAAFSIITNSAMLVGPNQNVLSLERHLQTSTANDEFHLEKDAEEGVACDASIALRSTAGWATPEADPDTLMGGWQRPQARAQKLAILAHWAFGRPRCQLERDPANGESTSSDDERC